MTSSTKHAELVAVGAAARPGWKAIVAGDENVSAIQTPEWNDSICALGRHEDVSRLYETADGRQLIVPLVRQRRRPDWCNVEDSYPVAWEGCGPLATGGLMKPDDVVALSEDLRSRPVMRTNVWVPRAADSAMWAASTPPETVRLSRRVQVVDLTGGFDEVWRGRFTSKVRSASRKAERRGVTVESDAIGRLLPIFDALYRKSVDRWASEAHIPLPLFRRVAGYRNNLRKYQAVFQNLGDACRLYVAWKDGEPVCGIIVLMHGTVATFWRGAMDKDRIVGTGANELLHRVAIEAACERGCLSYDMGESPGSPLEKFKATFGAGWHSFNGFRFERLPITKWEANTRQMVKRALGVRYPGADADQATGQEPQAPRCAGTP